MLISELLTEMIWDDRFEAAKVARRYPNAWIHFAGRPAYSKGDPEPVYKLGINPRRGGNGNSRSGHHDPPGIYFYPVKFLFSEEASLSQYATEYKYFYVVQFKRSAKIINLNRMTMDDAVRIATANGWIDDLREVMQHPELLAKLRPMEPKLLKRPGGIFYATMDYLANVKGRPWLGMLKGYHGLIDPGRGFISGGEVAQAVIFGRQHLQVLAQGENVDHGDREYAGILQQIAQEFGGKFYFKNKLPIAEFDNDGRPFRIVLNLNRWKIELSYYEQGFWHTQEVKYSTTAGDRQSHYGGLRYYVTSTAQKAEAPGKPMYWNGDRVSELLKRIRPSTRILQTVEEDGLHVWQSLDSWGGFYPHLRAVVSHEDQVRVDAVIEADDQVYCNVSQQFGQEPVEQVADKVLDEMARQMHQNIPNPTALNNALMGFAWGDRFHG